MKNVMAPYWTFWTVTDMGHGWWLLLSFEGIAPALSTHHSVGNGWQTMLACRFCHRIFTLRSCINTRVHLKQIFCPTIPWQVSLWMQLLTNTKIVTVKIASLMRTMAWSTDHRWRWWFKKLHWQRCRSRFMCIIICRWHCGWSWQNSTQCRTGWTLKR